MKTLILPLLTLLLGTGCSSLKIQKEWDERKVSPDFIREKATFKERLGGKEICGFVGIFNFVTDHGPKPSAQCLYPTSPYQQADAGGLGQPIKQLKVFQVTPDGVLLKSVYPGGRIIFVHKPVDKTLVDNSFFDETNQGGYYEYAGPYSYKTTFGSNTVNSFKRFPDDAPANALRGLVVYNPIDEILADLGLWDQLGQNLKARQGQAK